MASSVEVNEDSAPRAGLGLKDMSEPITMIMSAVLIAVAARIFI